MTPREKAALEALLNAMRIQEAPYGGDTGGYISAEGTDAFILDGYWRMGAPIRAALDAADKYPKED